MSEKKRKQHYVFQAYLLAWAKNEKIWCVRKNGKPFNTNTINVAQERDFYRVTPLNNDERRFLKLIYADRSAEVQKALEDHIDIYLQPFEAEQKLKTYKYMTEILFGGYDGIPNEIKREIANNEKKIDIWKNNIVEDSYSEIEGESIKWLNLLKKQDVSFYYSNNEQPNNGAFGIERYSFLFFLCSQYFRTKAIKKRWIAKFGICLNHPQWKTLNIPKENIKLENVQPHLFWYIQTALTFSLWKKNAHLTVLVNKTSLPFITSDQPVINLKADYQNMEIEPTDLIFYYPISPEIAITVNDEISETIDELDLSEVDRYNRVIVNSSYENIFAINPESIERYISKTNK